MRVFLDELSAYTCQMFTHEMPTLVSASLGSWRVYSVVGASWLAFKSLQTIPCHQYSIGHDVGRASFQTLEKLFRYSCTSPLHCSDPLSQNSCQHLPHVFANSRQSNPTAKATRQHESTEPVLGHFKPHSKSCRRCIWKKKSFWSVNSSPKTD